MLLDDLTVVYYVSDEEVQQDRQATTEEIALFKRAEHFHKKGRKLNEFKMDDILKNECDMYYFYSDRDMNNGGLYNADDCLIGEVKDCNLIMTAEELEAAQEVRK